MRPITVLLATALVGCGPQVFEAPPPGGTPVPTVPPDPTDPTVPNTDTAPPVVGDCAYPNAVEPMAVGAPLFNYTWADARHRDGRTGSLDLVDVHCDTDPDMDWSPFDVLLFVSIPAW